MFDAEIVTDAAELSRDIASAVVGENTSSSHALFREPRIRPLDEGFGPRAVVSLQHLHVGHSRMIVDSDMHPLPTGFRTESTLAGDPMTGTALDSSEPLGIQVQHVSRCGMFVAKDRRCRIEESKPSHTRRPAHPPHGGHTPPRSLRNLTYRHPTLAQFDDPYALLIADLPGLTPRSRTAVLKRLLG
jgi:hypothetical protein